MHDGHSWDSAVDSQIFDGLGTAAVCTCVNPSVTAADVHCKLGSGNAIPYLLKCAFSKYRESTCEWHFARSSHAGCYQHHVLLRNTN